MKKKIAFLFPGQGAQYVGMGKDFCEMFSIARETFQEADEILGAHLSKVIFEGPDSLLTQTKHSQTAIFVTSLAVLRVVQQQLPDLVPQVVAGLSLGEYTALCASERLGFTETLRLVQERANWMNEACERVPGTMAAVLGLEASGVEAAIQGLSGVWVANYNAPGQTVISGTKEGVEKAALLLKEKGAKRVLPLSVHGAFHSGLMESARLGLAPSIQRAPLRESAMALVLNVTGNFAKTAEEIRTHLIAQVTHSVRWEQSVQTMVDFGCECFFEIGCGKTLTGLNKKIAPSLQTLSIDKVADLDAMAALIGV